MAEEIKLIVGFITTVSGRWPRDLPERRNKKYSDWVRNTYKHVELVKGDGIAFDNKGVKKTAELFRKENVDLVIVLIGAFTGDAASVMIAEKTGAPVIIWALREPPFDGKRLMSNALVAATMNTAALKRLDYDSHFIYGGLEEDRVIQQMSALMRLYHAKKKLNNTFIGMFGYRPTAFYSSTFDETLIRKKFGISLEEFDLSMIFKKAGEQQNSKIAADVKELESSMTVRDLPDGYLENHSRVYFALKELIDEQGFDAVSLKCWPEMGQEKLTPCAVLSRFADDRFVIGCESDLDATITMLMQKYLADDYTFMCDLININEKENTVLFWHCGQAARQLHRDKTEALATNHSLAGEGVVIEGTLKEGPVTIARLSRIGDTYKLFVIKGNAVHTKKEVRGVMVNVMLEKPVMDIIYTIAEQGIPHHYSIVWKDIHNDMIALSGLLKIDIIEV
ncbi:MAG: hypothetical protein JW969_09275 [Spirochaetales bacterium]|nr:hypothetical protein [Spirochaetales bacterium]